MTSLPGAIIVGYDGSDRGQDALALGRRLAQASGDRLIVTCIHPQEAAHSLGALDTEWVAYLRDQAKETIEEAKQVPGTPEGVETVYEVRGASSASRGMDGLAEEYDADTIVLGSSARAARRRARPGSTGHRLLQGSASAISLAPRNYREGPTGPLARIGCAFLDTPDGQVALQRAISLAQRSAASLHVFTVSARRAERFVPLMGDDAEDGYLLEARASLQAGLDRARASVPDGVEAEASLLTGNVVDALSALDDRDVDVLVCGSRGYGPLGRVLLGGVSERLTRHAAVPVLVVPRSAV
ncbi:MAG: universal stress protein [Geodermatophilaceae bacterium]|nr:universal stress protein [Geodermatophilaceae bacterium]